MSNQGKKDHHHPLHQIAESATHKLLLKQWLKEEELIARRVALREARLDGIRGEIAFLCCAFFVFHSTALVVLFAGGDGGGGDGAACRRSWIPCVVSLACSMAMVWAIRYKAAAEKQAESLLQREEEDGRLLKRCAEELKRKGMEFDLLKEVDALRRAKSLRVEAAGASGGRWSGRDFTVMFFVAASGGALVLCR